MFVKHAFSCVKMYQNPISAWRSLIGMMFLAVCFGAVTPLSVRAADSTQATNEPKRVVVLGDSLAAGLGVEPSEAFPALLQKMIEAEGWSDVVVNAGVSGDTSADGLNRINWLLRQKVDVLVLELGGNDGLRGLPVSATKTNLQAIIDRVKKKYPAAQIVIAGMQMPPNMGEDYTTAFKAIYPDLAAKNHAALVPFLLAGVGGIPALNQPDRIHPNAEGHRIVAENVWKELKPVLEKLQPAKDTSAP